MSNMSSDEARQICRSSLSKNENQKNKDDDLLSASSVSLSLDVKISSKHYRIAAISFCS